MSRLTSIFINFAIVFLLGYFWIFPQYQDLQEVNAELRNKRAELQQKEDYFSKIEKAAQALERYKTELSKIDSALPSEPSLSSILNIVERSATENGLILRDVGDFKVADFERESREIRLEIGLVGAYPALKNFLSALERNSRLIIAENIIFSTPKPTEPFIFNLIVKTYSY